MTFLAFKKNEILTHVTAWMSLENIMQSKIIQAQNGEYRVISLIGGTQKTQIHRDRKKGDSGRWGRRTPGVSVSWGQSSHLG